MTSINAIKFNQYQGACVCDESISSSDSMRLNVSDKFQNCIPEVITEKYGIVAALGTTGSCALGEQLKQGFVRQLKEIYRKEIDQYGCIPDTFMEFSKMAPLIFEGMVEYKYQKLNDRFRGQYGFSLDEFIEGSYQRDGHKYEIKDKNTISELCDLLGSKHRWGEMSHVFLNAALLAGYDDKDGFCIYHYDLREGGYWHKLQNFYMAEGSGRHSVDPVMLPYAENLLLEKRRGDIDPVEGMMLMLQGFNNAVDHEVGVGGYPNIVLINGKEKDYKKRMREISDQRAHLAAQIAKAVNRGYTEYSLGYELLDQILFHEAEFKPVYQNFIEKTKDKSALIRFLRGYKVLPFQQQQSDIC